jgi:hypothetical protein
MRVSRLLGLMVMTAFVILFLQTTPVTAGEHPWIENPAAPPVDSGVTVHEVSEPIAPEMPTPVIERIVLRVIPLWWQMILVNEKKIDGDHVTVIEHRSPRKMNLYGGARITVTSPPR